MEGGGKAEAEQKAKAARKRLEGILTAKQRDNSEEGDEDSDFPWGKERPRLADLQLSSYEQTIAMEVVAPEDISVKFDGTCCLFGWEYGGELDLQMGGREEMLTADRYRRS
jgi:hypothetical protein